MMCRGRVREFSPVTVFGSHYHDLVYYKGSIAWCSDSHFPTGTVSQWTDAPELKGCPEMAQLRIRTGLCATLMEAQLFALLHRAHTGHHQILLWTDSNTILTWPADFHDLKSSHSISCQPLIYWMAISSCQTATEFIYLKTVIHSEIWLFRRCSLSVCSQTHRCVSRSYTYSPSVAEGQQLKIPVCDCVGYKMWPRTPDGEVMTV